jgi:hypothetical protein
VATPSLKGVAMGRKTLKNQQNKEDVKNLTHRERCLARLVSLIFALNNNGSRYGFSYLGYEFVFSKYNFSAKSWDIIESHNFTKMSYDRSYKTVHEINKKLRKELLCLGEDIAEWEEEYEE